MKTFILSDLHIGYEGKDIQYSVMDRAITYIDENYQPGDKILGLGDWFHIEEMGLAHCISHQMAKKFDALAARIPTTLIPGNHDRDLGKCQNSRPPPDPISHIAIHKHFMEGGVWFCHGHEYDCIAQLPTWIGKVASFFGKKTPGKRRSSSETTTENYLKLTQVVQVRAWLDARDKPNCKGIVFGHTHLPLCLKSPDSGVPFLINDGDMRQSATFAVREGSVFQLLTWDAGHLRWEPTPM